jgi:hypothetical protein
MGWSDCGTLNGRRIGYSISATCDKKGCKTKIDRGLAFVCGNMHGGGEHGCGGYFCEDHLACGYGYGIHGFFCSECGERLEKEYPEPNEKGK